MRRIWSLLILGLCAVTVTSQGSSKALFAQNTSEIKYEVLSPWAEVDPIPLRGIVTARVDSLAGKKLGIFANYKRAALPIAKSLEKRLNTMFPDSETSIYHSTQWNVTESETENRDKFKAWVTGVDAIILDVGD